MFPDVYSCKECAAPLAPDQKYCVSCGERRGALPSRMQRLFAALDVAAPPAIAGVPPFSAAPPAAMSAGLLAGLDNWLDNAEYPTPRVAALAVITVLAFGVLLGSVVGATTKTSPLYVMQPAGPAAAATPIPAAAETPIAPAAELAAEPAAPAAEAAPTEPTAGIGNKVNHVWLIVLSGQGYDSTFGNTQAQSYLTSDLVGKGEIVQNHFSVAQGQLANSIALVSGQGPTWQISQNCPAYNDLAPGTVDLTTGQALGDGCVFPDTVKTISDAVTATGKSAFAYVEDIDNGANGSTSACRHPESGAADPDHTTDAGNAYASWSNPFVYFKSVVAGPNCEFQMGGLKTLDTDLAASRSPAFALVVPNRCHDGSDTPCAPGATAGIGDADEFLRSTVTKIMGSKDYLDGGLIAITFDSAPQGAAGADLSGCCGQPLFPNLAVPPAAAPAGATDATGATTATGATDVTGALGATGATDTSGPTPATPAEPAPTAPSYVLQTPTGQNAGGGKVGLLLLSPLVKEASTYASEDSNHFSLLLSIENWLGTEKLGYTNDPNVSPLADSVFNKTATGG
jgi:hypothetical protein